MHVYVTFGTGWMAGRTRISSASGPADEVLTIRTAIRTASKVGYAEDKKTDESDQGVFGNAVQHKQQQMLDFLRLDFCVSFPPVLS